MSDQRLLTIPTFSIMLEHHTIMRDVIRTMDESGEPYVREASFISRLHRYIQGQSKEKQKQLRTAFSTDNLLASHILVDKDEFGGESRLIFDRAVIGVFRLFDRSLFQDLTDVALKIQLGGIRLLLEKLQSSSMLYSDSDLDFKELIDELFHQLSELLNSIRLNLVKMQTINQELSDASELAAKSHNPQVFCALQQESIEKISLLLSRHILPTRQFLDEKSRLKDGPNLFECLQSLRSQFDLHQDHQRANAMLRYEVSFNSFHKQISKVSQSVDQFLARSKKRLQQFNAIEGAFNELLNELDATKQNLKRSQIDGQFARDNGSFMGLMQQARPKVLRISSSEAYLNNVVSDIEARVVDRSLLEQSRYVDLVSVKDDSTEQRLARAEQIFELVKDMKMAEYQDLTLSLHRRLKDYFSDYHFVDLLEGLNFILRSEAMLDGHRLKMTNFRQRLAQGDNIYLYRKIRTERRISVMSPFSQINMAKSQQIYATFVNGKVITKQVYDLYQQSFLDSPLYTELYNNLDHFTQLYLHIGYTLNFNVEGEFFYISRSEAEEDADTNATKIQAMLLIIARYWVDKGFDLDDLLTPVIGLGRTALEEIAEQTIYDDIRQALGIETWDKAVNYLADRNFLYQCGDKHYILSSAGMHFLNLHVEKYAQEQD